MIFKCLLLLAVVAATGSQIQKRSDDTLPLQDVVTRLTSELEALKAQNAADVARLQGQITTLQNKLDNENHKVAFLAKFFNTWVTEPASGVYIFDNVILNDGNGYDPQLGIFTAPYSGVYIISAQFYSHGTQPSRPMTDIILNDKPLVRYTFDGQIIDAQGRYEEDSRATSVVVKLNEGDRVWTTTPLGHELAFFGTIHSFFSGALLYSV